MADEEKTTKHPIDHLDQEQVRRILNVLTEAPYFYQEDDLPLFQYLRRRKAAFEDFFKLYFGWDLVVDAHCARLLKRERANEALRDGELDAFRLTRRNHCLAFALLLEFFEFEARRTNWDADKDAYLRFFYNDYLDHARRRLRELLGERMPEDAALLREVQETWDILKRYRFIRFVPPLPTESEAAKQAGELYEFLPAIYLYDTRVLSDPAWIDRLKSAEESPDAVSS